MDGQLKRSSLGRLAFIGELYDVRTESFSSRSLLNPGFPSGLVECRDVHQMDFEYRFTENASERFDLLNVEGELQVCVLLGLVSVEGSGSFLTKDAKSEKTVSCTLLCRMRTVCEKFFAPFAEILGHIDLTALEDPRYTHLVSEVTWGANCLLSLEAACKELSSKEELKGKLKGELKLLKTILSGGGGYKPTKETSTTETDEDIKIKVSADVVPDGHWPTSVEGFKDFVANVPNLLKKFNGGKGKPLNYVMIPLDSFRKLGKLSVAVERVVRAIDESFLISIVYLFEEIALIKRKLHDLTVAMSEMRNYVSDENLKEVRKQEADLIQKESKLKLIVSEGWVEVKSGTKKLHELVRLVEKFKGYDLQLISYEDYLDSSSAIVKKLALVRHYLSMGVTYLGKEDDFSAFLAQNLSSEFLVFLVSSEMEKRERELCACTCYYFLAEASSPSPNTKYVVVDFDYRKERTFMNVDVTSPRCVHIKGGKILNMDAYASYVADSTSSFVRLKPGAEIEYIRHKPGNRVPLEMTCPSNCSFESHTWTCFRCKTVVEYGFDEFFYCLCGRGQVSEFEYRCCEPLHGELFCAGKAGFVEKALNSLRPLKEMNVLILGQSGVGKSTWINSIVNYLNFESLDLAKEHGVICTIPTKFVMYDSKTLKKHVIQIGEDSNEVTETGHSATQSAHTYNFLWEDKNVRIIDTPGLGDTRGIEQDKKNLLNIIQHIGHLSELHAVCILLKANDNRLTPIFSYCLKELFSHLHKGATKNVVFCFTNARNSLYTPGQTSALLDNLIRNLGAENLSLGYHNMFCLDNEAFLFLCSLSDPEIHHDPALLKSFNQSWEISLNETRRLFSTIKTFEPHKLKETLSLVAARNRILNLAKPIAEISKTIHINLATIQRQKDMIQLSDKTVEELLKNLQIDEIFLVSEPLSYPRTVCTSPSCIEYCTFKGVDVQEIIYKSHCHKHCNLTNVTTATVNNPLLRECVAMGPEGKCQHCGCGWECHMHITYAQKRVERKVINETVKENIKEKESNKQKIENCVRQLEEKIKTYKKEESFIMKASLKFGAFLRQNAIAVFNDSVSDYLEYLIDLEEKKPFKSETEKHILENMKKMLEQYLEEVKIFSKVLREGENEKGITIEEMMQLEQDLYDLEIMGESLRNSAECNRFGEKRAAQYGETPLKIFKFHKKLDSTKMTDVSLTQKLMRKVFTHERVKFLLKYVTFEKS